MKKLICFVLTVFIISCSSEPSLQKYFVDKTEDRNFTNVDITPSMFIKADNLTLSGEEKAALESFKKMNVLVFKTDGKNAKEYETEKAHVKSLLKDEKYDELVKYNSGGQGATVSTIGEGDKIDEVVVFVHNTQNGFGVIRILSDDMTPNNVLTMVGLMQKANLNLEQLKPLQELMKK